ncbi:glutaredoxin homolog1 [Zea mays]|uniref:Glutaredoxin homolog1 n=1 Tax=Zea mays TaxID=4577 RepID=A0A1D6E6A9_MAIZE|nr:glutaredoxin homolog1 [Zea mays]
MGITSSTSSPTSSPESRAMALAKAKEIVASAPLVVFSKTSCPFCVRVKQLFEKLGASYKAIELDKENTMALNNDGKLVPLLTEAGAIAGSASKTTITA